MEQFELVEKLKNSTGVSFEVAKAALEATNYNLLDAAVYLEKQGKVQLGSGSYSAGENQQPAGEHQPPQQDPASFSELVCRGLRFIVDGFAKLLSIGNKNSLVIHHENDKPIAIPITLFVIVLLLGFWIVLPLMLVGMFCGFHYCFSGPNFGKQQVNDVMQKMTQTAEKVKQDFQNELNKDTKE